MEGLDIRVSIFEITREDGSTYVLPEERRLADDKRNAERALSATMRELAAAKPADEAAIKTRISILEQQVEVAQEAIDRRAELVRSAKEITYSIKTPTYGELLDLEDASKVERNGMPTNDLVKMSRAVLPFCVVGKKPEEVRAMNPVHIRRIWDKWYETVYPGDSQLPN